MTGKPILVIRHADFAGPAYCGSYLTETGRDWVLCAIDRGDAVPRDPRAYAGLIVMGGPMGANDPLPWLRDELRLIGRAVEEGVPVLGHCLGGQLLAKALGGEVSRMPQPEIGWHPIRATTPEVAQEWLDGAETCRVLQWHEDRFTVPPGATLLADGPFGPQMFAHGPHIGMQFHIEATQELVTGWLRGTVESRAALVGVGSVQLTEEMLAGLPETVANSQRTARGIYTRWAQSLWTGNHARGVLSHFA